MSDFPIPGSGDDGNDPPWIVPQPGPEPEPEPEPLPEPDQDPEQEPKIMHERALRRSFLLEHTQNELAFQLVEIN